MLQKIQFDDQKISLFQDNVDKALTPLQQAPLTGGRVLSALALVSGGANNIEHHLGYVPRLVFFFAPNVDTRLWSPSSNSTTIDLRCSTSCTVSVWIT